MTDQTDQVELTDEQREAQSALEEKEGQAGLASGFARISGKDASIDTATTGATEKSAAEVEAEAKAAAEAQAAEAKAVDEAAYNALPRALRDRVERLESIPGAIDKLAGHVGGFKRQLDAAVATATAAASSKGGVAPTDAEVSAAQADKSGEKWKQVQVDFPDWAEALEERLAGIGAQKPVDVDALKKDVTGTVEARVSQGVDEAEERAFLRLKYPTWKNDAKTPEFRAWFAAQPAEIQSLGSSTLADDAIKVFDSYSVHRKSVSDAAAARQRNQRRLEGAVTPRGTSHPVTPGTLPDEEGLNVGFNKVRRASV